MKIKAVAAVCKKNKAFCLFDSITEDGEVGAQWLGDGHAVYPLQGLPRLEEESIFTMFDITEKQRDKIIFRHEVLPEGINFKDADACENIIEDEKLSFAVDGKVLRPLRTTQGITFIDAAYLAPFADAADMMELYERVTQGGTVYIVVKMGLLLMGVIMPYDLISTKLVEKLDDLLRQCRFALEQKASRRTAHEYEADEEQMGFGYHQAEQEEKSDAE